MPVLINPKPLIVGEAPSPDPDVVEVLCPHTTSGRRLCNVLPEWYGYDEFRRVNLFDHRVRPGRWRSWHRDRARAAAHRLLFPNDWMPAVGLMVLLGEQVATAFGLDYRPCSRQDHYGVTCLVIPHPSGLNRWWNDKANVRRARAFLKRHLGD